MNITIRENEKIIKVVKQHKIFLFPTFTIWPTLLILVFFSRYLYGVMYFGYWSWVLGGSTLLVFLIIFYKVHLWTRNILVLTNQRAVGQEQKGLFTKTIRELLYRDILEISYTKDGFRASMYNYGDIRIKTAGNNKIIFKNVSNPDGVVEIINTIR